MFFNYFISITICFIPQSFDNNGFVDYDYEDLAYHSDLDIDSGYQEPQEVLANAAAAASAALAAQSTPSVAMSGNSSVSRGSPRLHVSTPKRIERPNMAPLNLYPTTGRPTNYSHQQQQQQQSQQYHAQPQHGQQYQTAAPQSGHYQGGATLGKRAALANTSLSRRMSGADQSAMTHGNPNNI